MISKLVWKIKRCYVDYAKTLGAYTLHASLISYNHIVHRLLLNFAYASALSPKRLWQKIIRLAEALSLCACVVAIHWPTEFARARER